MEMIKRVKIAKRRRAKLLAEFTRPRKEKMTVEKMALKHGITSARMSLLLAKARIEAGGCD